jgi:hypothetical protein
MRDARQLVGAVVYLLDRLGDTMYDPGGWNINAWSDRSIDAFHALHLQ